MARNGNAKTRRFALNMLKAGVAIFGAALLFACGDDSSSGADGSQTATGVDSTVESVDDLLNCTSKHEGETAYIKEENATYVCTDGDWVADSKGKSGSSVESSSSVIPGSDPESSSSVESSSSRGFFDMTKDEFLNPKVSYGEMTDERDGQKYKTVKIGDQMWMAENLNYDYNKGTAKSFCYDGIEANCEVTGRLYTWAAAIDSVALANDADNPQTCGDGKTCTLPTVVQGVCPSGWHLPSYDEWQTLFTAVGGSSKAGTALKSQTGWKSQTGDAADRDAYGFSALPAGIRHNGVNYTNAGYDADFWSASERTSERSSHIAYFMYLDHYEFAKLYSDYKNNYCSVRCLQN